MYFVYKNVYVYKNVLANFYVLHLLFQRINFLLKKEKIKLLTFYYFSYMFKYYNCIIKCWSFMSNIVWINVSFLCLSNLCFKCVIKQQFWVHVLISMKDFFIKKKIFGNLLSTYISMFQSCCNMAYSCKYFAVCF